MVGYKVLIGLGICLFLLLFGFARLGYFGTAKADRVRAGAAYSYQKSSGNDKMNDMIREKIGSDSRLSQEQKNKLMKMLGDPSKRSMILNRAMPGREMGFFEQIMAIFGFGPQPKKYNNKYR